MYNEPVEGGWWAKFSEYEFGRSFFKRKLDAQIDEQQKNTEKTSIFRPSAAPWHFTFENEPYESLNEEIRL